jgi:hypothetical protein
MDKKFKCKATKLIFFMLVTAIFPECFTTFLKSWVKGSKCNLNKNIINCGLNIKCFICHNIPHHPVVKEFTPFHIFPKPVLIL